LVSAAGKDFCVDIRRQDLKMVKKIGAGGFASVYHMTWESESGIVHVAAKILNEVDTHELEVMSKLHHPNIVKLIGVVNDEIGHTHMLILELCEHGSLRSYLKMNGKLTPDLFDRWVMDAAKAIGYLRQMKLVHKDVKSDNYLIAGNNVLKLCDFGLTKEINNTVGDATQRGTLTYMAPELLGKCKKQSPKFDIFAFAIVVWEMLTGLVPFEGIEGLAVVWKVCHENQRLEIPADCPPYLEELMTLCWQRDHEKRPSIEDVVNRLGK
jgi:serine/threonine protein kinase